MARTLIENKMREALRAIRDQSDNPLAVRLATEGLEPPSRLHGKASLYNYKLGCRCIECQKIWSNYNRNLKKGYQTNGRCVICTKPRGEFGTKLYCVGCKVKRTGKESIAGKNAGSRISRSSQIDLIVQCSREKREILERLK